jgi:hypothetical protein
MGGYFVKVVTTVVMEEISGNVNDVRGQEKMNNLIGIQGLLSCGSIEITF